jgi:hypothetical protein
MYKKLLIAFLLASAVLVAQGKKPKKEAKPVFHEVSNKDVVQSVYPDAAKVEKVNDYWYRIIDQNNKVLGFAMSSLPYCLDVKRL